VPRKKKKKNKKMYFGPEVEDGIIRYNAETNAAARNKIYSEEIAYAFDKLCENIINTFKFSYFDSASFADIKQEVTSFLVLNMHKFDHTKGYKAFSYFSVVAKNYLILVNNGNYKKMKLHSDLTATRTLRELSEKSYRLDTGSYAYDFMNEIITYFEDNIAIIFKKKRDIDIAYSIIELLKRRDDLDNFNKKSLYLLIREMTGVNTTYITKVVNEMKRHYKLISDTFSATGTTHLPPTPKSFF
jgi:hypothetical protein